MTYRITGLSPEPFRALFAMSDEALAERRAVRVVADSKPGFPCRITLADAEQGEPLILVHHVSHDVATPYRSAYAIYIRDTEAAPPSYVDEVPPCFAGRALSLRAFGADEMVRRAVLAAAGEADDTIRDLFADPGVATIQAHFAAYGCFAARIERQ